MSSLNRTENTAQYSVN